jgi:hypothetical protein
MKSAMMAAIFKIEQGSEKFYTPLMSGCHALSTAYHTSGHYNPFFR